MRKYVILCVLLLYTIIICGALPTDNFNISYLPAENAHADEQVLVRKRRTFDEEDCDIVFPDKSSVKSGPRPKPCHSSKFSAKGKGRKCVEGVCADAVDYPYDQIQKIKHKLAGYRNLFGELNTTVTLVTKFGETDSMPLCATTIHTIYPKTLPTDKNKNIEKFIVNDEGHKQGLSLETCKEKATCMFSPLFPNTYTSECTQRYATRRLMALDEDGNPGLDSFVVPSCCLCMVKKN